VTDLGLIEELQKDVPADLPLNDAARGALARALQRHGPHAPELTVANASRKTQRLSFRLDGDWIGPWEVDEESA